MNAFNFDYYTQFTAAQLATSAKLAAELSLDTDYPATAEDFEAMATMAHLAYLAVSE